MRLRARASGSPNTVAVPDSAGTMPSTAFSSVDLPAPLGPMMAAMQPAGTVASTEKMAGFPP